MAASHNFQWHIRILVDTKNGLMSDLWFLIWFFFYFNSPRYHNSMIFELVWPSESAMKKLDLLVLHLYIFLFPCCGCSLISSVKYRCHFSDEAGIMLFRQFDVFFIKNHPSVQTRCRSSSSHFSFLFLCCPSSHHTAVRAAWRAHPDARCMASGALQLQRTMNNDRGVYRWTGVSLQPASSSSSTFFFISATHDQLNKKAIKVTWNVVIQI